MKKIKSLALLALLLASPLLLGAGVGGFPSILKPYRIEAKGGPTAYTGQGNITGTRFVCCSATTPLRMDIDATGTVFNSVSNIATNSKWVGFSSSATGYMLLVNQYSGGPTVFGVTAPGDVSLAGIMTSTRACLAGHTRLTPNFCRRDNGVNNVLAAGTDGTCKQTTTLSGTNIKAVVGYIRATVYSANAVGARSLTVGFFSDSGCTAVLHSDSYAIYEQAATTAGFALTKKYLPLVITSSTAGQFYMKETGGDGVADFIQTGYLD